MTRVAIFSLLMMVFGVALPGASAATSPSNVLTYQGRVLDSNGSPVADASLNMKFFLYNQLAGGTCVWSNSSSTCDANTPGLTAARAVSLTDGLFTQNLGDTGDTFAAIPDSVFADDASVYLEVVIGGETLTPRKLMTAVPYALNAQSLDGIDATGFLASTGDTATGAYDFSGAAFSGGSALVFEGATDNAFESTFAFTDPTADRTITFQNASGTVAFLSDITSTFESGVNGLYEDDASVIVGADAAFSSASGGIGDLKVASELEVDGASFLEGALTVAGTAQFNGIADLNGDVSIFDSNIEFDGAATVFTTVGPFTLTPGGSVVIGDGGDTLALNSSDWDISLTGDMSGIGSIAADGLISGSAGLTVSGGVLTFSSATVAGASPLQFEGATSDAFESTFAFTDPTADRTITFQNASGTVAFLADIGSSLFETGAFGTYEDDAAVIVGTDAAFSSASGGAGDLKVEDELEADHIVGGHEGDGSGSNLSLTGATGTGSTDAGGAVVLVGGTGGAGDGGASSGNGGAVNITAGTAGNEGGAATAGNGGAVSITAGNGQLDVGTSSGGAISLVSGSGSGMGMSVGGDITLDTGVGAPAGRNGRIFLISGSQTAPAGAFSGSINILSQSDRAINIGEGTTDTQYVNIGGTSTDNTSNISIATNNVTSDTITIGNTNVGTNLTITGGDDWSINAAGLATFGGGLTVSGGDVAIADTDIAFNGASTTFTTTGAFTITPGGALVIGDNGDTMAIDSSDWDISTTGAMTGIGSISADGLIATSGGLTVSTGVTSLSGSTVSGASPLVFEGTTDNAFESTFTFTDPTADRTITFPDASGTVAMLTDIPTALFEAGANGTYEDDAAVLVGADAAFTSADGGVGDLKVASELEVDGAAYLEDALTVTGLATFNGSADLNGNVSIADTDIAFDGATTAFTTTGTFTLTPGDAVVIGDGGDTLALDSSVWDISGTGDFSGAGSITSNGLISTSGGLTVSAGVTSLSGSTLSGASPLTFEGTTDNAFESTFAITDPTADRTITFRDASGTVALLTDIPAGLFEAGVNGTYEDDAAVIVGTDAAFTSAGGGVGDLKVASELEVGGAAYLEDALTVTGLATFNGTSDLNGNLSVADTDIAFDGVSTTFTTTGDFTVTPGGAMVFGDGADSFAVDTAEFDIASATGSITIDDGGDTGAILVEGTNLDINDLTYVGAGTVASAAGSNLSITAGTTGTLTLDSGSTGTVNIGTSNNAKTINIGTSVAANIINIGTGADSIDTITIGSAGSTTKNFSLYGGSDVWYIESDGDAAFYGTALTLGTATGIINLNGQINSDIEFNSNLITHTIGVEDSISNVAGQHIDLVAGSAGSATGFSNGTDGGTGRVTAGAGAAAAVGFARNGGAGGGVELTAGNGGAGDGTGTNGNGGSVTITAGSAGVGGAGGSAGTITLTGGRTVIEGAIDFGSADTLVDGDTTPDISGGSLFISEQANDTVTAFDGDVQGHIWVIEFNQTTTFDCNGANNLQCGTVDIVTGTGDTMVWGSDGVHEILLSWMDESDGQTGADVAEWFPATEDLQAGDVVAASYTEPVHVSKSTTSYQTGLLGIVATQPGLVLSERGTTQFAAQIALAGRVPVKFSNENGEVTTGDFVTSSASRAGFAMKATEPGPVIGMAMENSDGATQIIVHVNNSWQIPTEFDESGVSTISTQNVVVAPVGVATAAQPGFDSFGLALRGSAWNGAEAQTVEMMIKNQVSDTDHYRLSIRNNADSEVAYVTQEGTMSLSGDLVIAGNLYPSDRGTAQTSKYIYYDGSSGAGGDFMRTNASGWGTGSYDFAEMFPSSQILKPGEVVVFDGNGESVRRADATDTEAFAGIVSTRPGFLAGNNIAGHYPIALAGRVPTYVSNENGAIKVGDPLTSARTPGFAAKAKEAGAIVGYALEPYNGEEDNQILVFVNAGHWGGSSTDAVPGTQNNASGFAQGGDASFTSLNMSGNIYLSGHDMAGIGRLVGLEERWMIEADGTIKTKGLIKTALTTETGETISTIAVTSPEAVITLTGTATLSGEQVEVIFEDVAKSYKDVISANAPVRVIVTPNGPVSLYVSEKDHEHFVVKRFGGEASDVQFDWMVTAYRNGFEPKPVEDIIVEQAPAEEAGSDVQAEEPVVQEEAAPQESPEITPVDETVSEEGDAQVEPPSEPIIEQPSLSQEDVQ